MNYGKPVAAFVAELAAMSAFEADFDGSTSGKFAASPSDREGVFVLFGSCTPL